MIKMVVEEHYQRDWMAGLLVKIGKRHNNRRVGTVLTNRGIETWPLDSHYVYEVISEGG